jgi:acyl-CoA synthetase (AMP-forming)/AMP-acid ligase II
MQIQTKTGLEWLTLPFILELNARRYPDKEAVVDYTYNKRFTYREAKLRSHRVANALTDLGVKDGDRIAYLAYSREETFHLLFGAASIAAILTPINFRLKLPQWVSQINHSDSVVLVCQDSLCGQIDPGRADMPKVKHYVGFGENVPSNWLNFEDLLAKASDKDPGIDVKHNDIVTLSYTSGTTGEPKGVFNTHSSWVGYGLGQAMSLYCGPTTRTWTLMDMIHRGGIYTTMAAMVVGGTIVYLERYEPSKSLEMVYREKLNDIYPTALALAHWVALPQSEKDQYDFSHVRNIWVGIPVWNPALGMGAGAFKGLMPSEVYNSWRKLFPNAKFGSSFLSTEGQFTLLEDDEVMKLPSADMWEGCAHQGTELMITDLEGEHELPDGESGLIWSRGMGSMDSFHKRPDLEKQMMKPGGWVTSEDCGYIDPETKMLVYTGRSKDIVRSGLENVPTGAVEDVIKSNPKIANCGVIGTPHMDLGETVTAVIQLKPGETITEEELTEYCRDKLPGAWRPRRVEILPELPLVGFKQIVDKKLLREQFGEKYKIV